MGRTFLNTSEEAQEVFAFPADELHLHFHMPPEQFDYIVNAVACRSGSSVETGSSAGCAGGPCEAFRRSPRNGGAISGIIRRSGRRAGEDREGDQRIRGSGGAARR